MASAVPDSDHVARYCSPLHIDHGDLQASAFLLRRNKNEKDLSVNWLEKIHPSDRAEQIRLLQQTFAEKMVRISAGAEFAVLNVGGLRKNVAEGCPECPLLEVLHLPKQDDPSRSGIFGIERDDQLVAELLLEAVLNHYPARSPRL